MPGRQPHLLIFEPDPRGHAQEWIGHLIAAARTRQSPPRLSVLVADELADRLESDGVEGIHLVRLTPREHQQCMHRRLAVSGFARWQAMRRHLRQTGASHGLFLSIDHLSLPLGIGLPAAARPVSGILFRPSVHYFQFDGCAPTWRERIRDWRKDVLYRGMLRNPAVLCILSLDPYFPAYASRHYDRSDKVVSLLDPTFPAPPVSSVDEKLAHAVPKDRTAFLLFGELTARKGVLSLLESLTRLPSEIATKVAVVLAGRIDPPLRDSLDQILSRIRATEPGPWLHVEDRRLTAGELAALVRRCDVVLAPYQRFVGSSGTLLWAARMGRPVICQEYGLVGQLAREHALGLAVNTSDPGILADALVAAVQNGSHSLGDRARMTVFAAAHSPGNFAQLILDRALRRPRVRGETISGARPRDLFAD